jgi:hypothetical protein
MYLDRVLHIFMTLYALQVGRIPIRYRWLLSARSFLEQQVGLRVSAVATIIEVAKR